MVPTRDADLSAEARSSAACDIHKSHAPHPLYTERHHIVPQAWQAFWRPEGPQGSNSARRASLVMAGDIEAAALVAPHLWDPRTTNLCRTGHGNVHFLLVRLMRKFAEGVLNQPVEPSKFDAWVDVLSRIAFHGERPPRSELVVAKLGIVRWVEAGGSLEALTNAGLFGEI